QAYIAAMPGSTRRTHRAHRPQRTHGSQMKLALLWHRGPRLVPQLPLLHEVHQGGFLPRTLAARWLHVRALDASGGKHACSGIEWGEMGALRSRSSVIRDRLARELDRRGDLVFAASSAAQSRGWQREKRLVNFDARARRPDMAAYLSRHSPPKGETIPV